jgi:hypothetical protein
MKVILRGKRWNLETIEYLQDGSCGSIDPPDAKSKRMLIALNQTPQDLLDTVIHECLHACYPDLDEDSITESATGIATVLYRLGCRVVLDGV